MSGLFNKLPGFQRIPPGMERTVLRRLPRITVLSTALPALPSLLARLAIWLDPALQSSSMPDMLDMLDIYVISLVILHWTVMFTAAIAAFIVMFMKGPAYVADRS